MLVKYFNRNPKLIAFLLSLFHFFQGVHRKQETSRNTPLEWKRTDFVEEKQSMRNNELMNTSNKISLKNGRKSQNKKVYLFLNFESLKSNYTNKNN